MTRARTHTWMRASGQGAMLDRRGRVRSHTTLLHKLDEMAAEAERQRQAAERAAQEVERDDSRPSPAPPQPPNRPPWPTQAEIDTFVDRLMADPNAPVTDELWTRFAQHEPSKSARERALGTVVALVADAWRDRLAAR